MAEFLTTNAISYYIENIIKESEEELYIFFPYLQLSREFYEALQNASERGVSVIIVYANEDLHTEEKLKLGELVNLEIYQSETLNAKCCCSEKDVLISSMDMHQLTSNDNLEMGVIFNKNSDNDLYKKVYGEVKSIIASSKNMNLHKRPVEELAQPQAQVKARKIYHGFCIKCAMPISYNLANPYCRSCMPKSDALKAAEKGSYCHLCGTPASTADSTPVCGNCRVEIS